MSTKRPENSVIIAALDATGGIILHAAERLGIVRQTLHRWISTDTELKAAQDEITEANLDLAESALMTAVKAGSIDAAKFYLRCKGRARGYGDHVEVASKVEATIPRVDYSMYSTEELEQLDALLAKGQAALGSSH